MSGKTGNRGRKRGPTPHAKTPRPLAKRFENVIRRSEKETSGCRLEILATATLHHRMVKRGGRPSVCQLADPQASIQQSKSKMYSFSFFRFSFSEVCNSSLESEPACTTIQQSIHNKQANRTTTSKPSTRTPQTSQHPKRVKTDRGRYTYSYGRVRRQTPGLACKIARLHNEHYGRTLSRANICSLPAFDHSPWSAITFRGRVS